jgi:hypothetical protein
MLWLLLAVFASLSLALFVFWVRTRRAEAKGLTLLLSNLTDEQRRQFLALGYFDATGSITGNHYRIHNGKARNVIELGAGRARAGRCFAPQGNLVAGDCMLAQKIAIENYEDEVLSRALPF